MRRAIAVLGILFAAISHAAEIKAPATIVEHSLVKVSLVLSDGEVEPKWVSVEVLTILDGDILFLQAEKLASKDWVFTGPPGRYTIRCTTFDEAAGLCNYTARTEITKRGKPDVPPKPDPQPDPPPKPDDDDDLPPPVEEKYGLVAFSKTTAPKDQPARGKAAGLAKNFDDLAASMESMVAAGSPVVIADALKDLKTRNSETVGTYRDAWLPWSEVFGRKMKELNQTGKMTTVKQHCEAFRETASGLRGVK